MHTLAHNVALQLKEQVDNALLEEFSTMFEFKKVYLGQTNTGEYVTVEEFIDGDFIKYINNDGIVSSKQHQLMGKAECFAYFTFQKLQGKFIVLDIQGSDQYLRNCIITVI